MQVFKDFTPQTTDSDVGWKVGDKFYINRLQAWEEAGFDKDKVKFYFRDDELDKVDFSNEPAEDWHTLLKQRCIKLREENDYLCLWYSAGTDSYTIYNIFKKYNIPLDEILFHDKTYDPYPYYETEKQLVFKHVEEFQKLQPNCKFTIMETGYQDAVPFYKRHSKEWIYHPFVMYRFSKPLRHVWLGRRTDIAERLFNPGTMNIQGSDPPRLWLEDKKWYHVVFDTHEFNTCALPTFYNFFWDDIKILVKQAHMAIQYYESLPFEVDNEYVQQTQRSNTLTTFSYRDHASCIGRDLVDEEFINNGEHKKYLSEPGAEFNECANLEKEAQRKDPEAWKIFEDGLNYYKQSNIQTSWAKLRYLKDYQVNT